MLSPPKAEKGGFFGLVRSVIENEKNNRDSYQTDKKMSNALEIPVMSNHDSLSVISDASPNKEKNKSLLLFEKLVRNKMKGFLGF